MGGSGSPSGIHVSQTLPVSEHDLTGAREPEYAVTVKLRECARDRFQREPQIVANVPATHRQRHHTGSGETAVHFKQEARNPLHRVLATEQQHVIFGMPELTGGHAPELAGDLNIYPGSLLKAAALDQAYGRVDDGFCGEAMAGARFEPEDVARQEKCADLAASVGKQLVSPDRAPNHLIDIFSQLIFAVDLLVLPVGKFRRHEAGVPS